MPYTIQGIELLTKQNYYIPTLLVTIIAIVIFGAGIYYGIFSDEPFKGLILIAFSLVFIVICIVSQNKTLTHCHTEYQVTISDEVQLQTLLSHYEIVSQDGKIYTLKEKTHDK